MRKSRSALAVGFTLVVLVVVALGCRYAVTHWRRPGSMTPVDAQAMDMSSLKPPRGAFPVQVYRVAAATMQPSVTYTGTVLPFNDQTITPRTTGRVVELNVYPGQAVVAGQLLARLDSDELRSRTAEAGFASAAGAHEVKVAGAQVAQSAAGAQGAVADVARSQGAVLEARAAANRAQDDIAAAQANLQSTRAQITESQAEAAAALQSARAKAEMIQGSQAAIQAANEEAAGASAALDAAKALVPAAQAQVAAATSARLAQEAKTQRSAALFAAGAISREELQADQAAAAAANAGLQQAVGSQTAAQASVTSVMAKVRQAAAQVAGAHAQARSARSEAAAATATAQRAAAKVSEAQAVAAQAVAGVDRSRADYLSALARIAQSQAAAGGAQAAAEGADAGRQKADLERGQAALEAQAAAAQWKTASIIQGYTQIRALAPGVVTQRLAVVGDLVSPAAPILRLAQLNWVRVQAAVAAGDLETMTTGMPVQVQEPGGATVATTVSAIFPAADASSRTGTVEVVVPNPTGLLKPGEFATLHIATGTADRSLRVPTEALVMETTPSLDVIATQQRFLVWVMKPGPNAKTIYTCVMHPQIREEKPGDCPICGMKLTPAENSGDFVAHEVALVTGATDGDWTQVKSGLPLGSEVIVRGFQDLREGDPVAVPPGESAFAADSGTTVSAPPKVPALSAPKAAPTVAHAAAHAAGPHVAPTAPQVVVPPAVPTVAPHAAPAATKQSEVGAAGLQTAEVSLLPDGYHPDVLHLVAGRPAVLTFIRRTDATCGTSVEIPDYGLKVALPLDKPVGLRFTPRKGTFTFICGMHMLKGTIEVR